MSGDHGADAHSLRLNFARGAQRFFKDIAPRLAVLIALIEAAFIYYAFFIEAPRREMLLKQVDVEMHCNLRWADLFKERLEIEGTAGASKAQEAAQEYYHQFWSLQNDQFYYYLQGFLPDDVFLDWAKERIQEFRDNKIIGGVPFRAGWGKYSVDFTRPSNPFITFMNDLVRQVPGDYDRAEEMKRLHEYRSEYHDDQE
jgi:hypothetical protein